MPARRRTLLFFAVVIQLSIMAQITILGGHPNLLLVTLVCVALRRGAVFGAVAGFSAGLLADTGVFGTLGFTALLLTLAGYWTGRYGETTGRDRAHAPLLKQRGQVAAQLRRQARRYGSDLERFLRERVPQMTEVRMNPATLQNRPAGVGKAVVNRGYRLLMGTVGCEGDAVLERLRRKLPYRASLLRVPRLEPGQRSQVEEMLLLCIVPERLPQWDWLF